MSLIVCFSGKIGSGKSSVVKALAERIRWKHAGFGDYLRAEIKKCGGDPTSRETQQGMGQRMVVEDPEGFCAAVLSYGDFRRGDNLLVDGVRHVEIFETLRKITNPEPVKLIFLAVGAEVQRTRIHLRSDYSDLDRAGAHIVEAGLTKSLPELADVVINADIALDGVVAACLEKINSWTEGRVGGTNVFISADAASSQRRFRRYGA